MPSEGLPAHHRVAIILSSPEEESERERGANSRNHLIAADRKDPAHQAVAATRRMLTYGEEVSRCDGLARVCIAAQGQACQDLHCTVYGRQKQRWMAYRLASKWVARMGVPQLIAVMPQSSPDHWD